jgi:hypothetical protein
MDSEMIRLECLKLAITLAESPDFVLERAKEFYDFVIGDNPARPKVAKVA